MESTVVPPGEPAQNPHPPAAPAHHIGTLPCSVEEVTLPDPQSTMPRIHNRVTLAKAIPEEGLVVLVLFYDFMDRDHPDEHISEASKTVAATLRETGVNAKLICFVTRVPSLGDMALGYARRLSNGARVFVPDAVFPRLLKAEATPDGRVLKNALILVENGQVVWESVGVKPDSAFDHDGLRCELLRRQTI
jgi:hypothetical protein